MPTNSPPQPLTDGKSLSTSNSSPPPPATRQQRPPRRLKQLLKELERHVRRLIRSTRDTARRWSLTWQAGRMHPAAELARWQSRPTVGVILLIDPAEHTPESALAATLQTVASLQQQIHRDWRAVIVVPADWQATFPSVLPTPESRLTWITTDNQAGWSDQVLLALNQLEQPATDSGQLVSGSSITANFSSDRPLSRFVLLLDLAATLTPDALAWIAITEQQPRAEWMYADEQRIDQLKSEVELHCKPDFSRFYLWARFFTGRTAAYARSRLRQTLGAMQQEPAGNHYELALRFSEQLYDQPPHSIIHIPHVLMQTTASSSSIRHDVATLQRFLDRRGVSVRVTQNQLDPRLHELDFQLPAGPQPRVAIVIPNRNSGALLRGCLESLWATTNYPNYEVIVVDHESDEPEALEFLAQQTAAGKLRVVKFQGEFNFSAMNNQAIATTTADWIVLLNNDVDGFSSGWLEQLLATAQVDDRLAALGALLYYPDGTVQHGGVFFGMGEIGRHGHIDLPHDALGYAGRLRSLQEVSALTAALVLVRRAAFDAVGGLDERHPSDFNDFDLCLKLRAAGFRVAYTPQVTACHYSSKTRRKTSRNLPLIRQQWGDQLRHDPFYHPLLSRERFELGTLSRCWPALKTIALVQALRDAQRPNQ
ncbi:MAG: glycosyltransferase family 2 protein [Planctomycetota bacterium]